MHNKIVTAAACAMSLLALAESFVTPTVPVAFGKTSLPLGKPSSQRKFGGSVLSLRAQEGEMDSKTAGILGGVSLVAVPVMLWSEYTLKTTGCGLPAGPGGALGALEGVSYLWVVGLVAYSLYTKVKTGKGLPPGPGGILGAAEGLAFLAVLAGVAVLGLQIKDYGYIPNAVPTEGGKCS
mmetsp:Transcript_24715/g.55876  ORF Transcript_24715/g.55876 Transcript_24715/m.55876 type:complete len:180 (-) Transcript_24715:97-636(-)